MSDDLNLRLKLNQIALIKARGYDVPDDEEDFFNQSDDDVEVEMNNTYYHPDDQERKIEVNFLFSDKKIGKTSSGDILEQIQRASRKTTILVFANGYNPLFIKNFKEAVLASKCQAELWRFDELLVNPLNHFLTPDHYILNTEEIAQELPKATDPKTGKAFLSQLKNFQNDPVIKWLGGKVGDVVRITYDSQIMGAEMIDYRVVRRV